MASRIDGRCLPNQSRAATIGPPVTAAPATAAAATSGSSAADSVALAPAPVGAPATTAAPRPTDLGLKAGSTDDNTAFDDYLAYRRKFLLSGLFAHDMDITERHVLRVVDEVGRPVLGAKIAIETSDGFPLVDLRTYADGRALFFPRLSSRPGASLWTARVSANGVQIAAPFERSTAGHVFMIEISRRIAALPGAPDARFAMTVYRD